MSFSAALCIPCFNAARFLPGLARSIEGQTLSFDEVVLYDDASTDGSADLAEHLGAFTQVIRGRRNRGPGAARNECLGRTASEWIHFQDADDLLAPQFLERTRSVCSDFDVVLVSARSAGGGRFSYVGINDAPDVIEYCLTHIIGGTFGLYRRAPLESCGGFADDLAGLGHEDPDLHVRLAASGARMRALDEDLVVHQPSSESFSTLNWEKCQKGAVIAARRYLSTLPERYAATITRSLVLVARECDNKGFLGTAEDAWRLAYDSRVPFTLPTRSGLVRTVSSLLGADVASALRTARPLLAARRLIRRARA